MRGAAAGAMTHTPQRGVAGRGGCAVGALHRAAPGQTGRSVAGCACPRSVEAGSAGLLCGARACVSSPCLDLCLPKGAGGGNRVAAMWRLADGGRRAAQGGGWLLRCVRARQCEVCGSCADPSGFVCVCLRSEPGPDPTPSTPQSPPTMMLEDSNYIINTSSNNAATFNKVSASGRVSEVLACSCSTYAGRPPSWV